MKVKECMHSGAQWAGPDTPLAEIARMMRDDDIGCVPVGENDRLIGMVTDRDITCRGVASGTCEGLTARHVMSRPIIYARADEELEDALRLMEKNRIRRLPVIDANKRLCGMLALGDISAKAGRDLTAEVMRAVAAPH